ncbi:DsrE family protein [Aliikangiella marina]|uniref:DsrE family protein n=1 Tax=Aliikangiella marina TaxID=1712262 RepID=A0A545TCN4_9GAMM|nr:DsrE family protein [Aliikangiella marina]TQV74969.1 DsrE family protein [Aliikangiella marina]
MKTIFCLLFLLMAYPIVAEPKKFSPGPLIKNYGPHAQVTQSNPISQEQHFKVAFDVADLGDVNQVNRKFESLARFLNMHVAAGIKAENIRLALIVHGKASYGVLKDKFFRQKFSVANPNQMLLQELMRNQVRLMICGQSAAYYEINNEQLLDGVEMALSAMTAHAVLQQQGYTINPF